MDGLGEAARNALLDALFHIKNKLTAEDPILPRLKVAGE
jgi:hypothetical protein